MSWAHSKVSPATSQPAESNETTIESLVATHYGFVWRVLRGLGLSPADAEDAAQQVFMIAARKLESITPDRARSYVYGTAVRVAHNARRGLRRRREVPAEDATEHAGPPSGGPEHAAELVRARGLLSELLAELPEKLRRTIILAEIEQLEIPEIAKLEGLPIGTAASRLRLARKQFRTLLEAARHRNPFAEGE